MVDDDLVAGLKQARTAPRNFAIVLKGPAPVKAIVQKKAIKDADLLKAKTAAKGNDVVTGVVVFDGGEYAFITTTAVEIGNVKLRALLIDSTEMPIKLRFEVRETLPEVIDDEAPPKTTGSVAPPSGSSTLPVPPPLPPTTQGNVSPPTSEEPSKVDPRKQKLLDGLKAITPKVKQLLAARPELKDQLVRGVAEVKTPLDGDKLDEATLAMRRLLELIQGLSTSSDEIEDEVEDGAGDEADDDFLERLVADDETAETEIETKQDGSTSPPKPEKTLEELTVVAPPTAAAESASVGGRVRWEEAKEEVAANLAKLQQHLRKSSDAGLQRIGEFGFHGITGRLQVGLRVALQEFDQAPKAEAREKFRVKALGIIQQYREFLAKDPLVAKCDENPFGVKVEARKILGDALAGLAKSLQA